VNVKILQVKEDLDLWQRNYFLHTVLKYLETKPK